MMPLKRALREHYQRERLDAHQLGRLGELVSQDIVYGLQRRRGVLAAVAAAFVLGVATALVWRVVPDSGARKVQRVAEEIARNHLALEPLDVVGATISQLRPAFSRMGFALMDSPRLEERGWRLQGGRHCSVQTIPAALLRYRTQSGEFVSVYEVPYDSKRYGDLPDLERGGSPLKLDVRGVLVELWVERGLLLATASSREE